MSIEPILTQANVNHIKLQIEAISFVRDTAWVGRIGLCGESEHDADLLVSIIEPNGWPSFTDQELWDWQLSIISSIATELGEMVGTHYCYGYVEDAIEWLNVTSKLPGGKLIINMGIITPDGFRMDLWFVAKVTAAQAVNHDYFEDKIQWRIDGGCP